MAQPQGFLRLDRKIKDDYLNRKLKRDEMLVLIWLLWEANPHNGKTKANSQSLTDDLFKGKYEKNYLNKIILALKRKKYLWFPNQQGRRGSFIVELDNYPLKDGGFTDISYRFNETFGRSASGGNVGKQAEIEAEVDRDWQKSERTENPFGKQFFTPADILTSRSPNNDNNNENDNDNIVCKSNLKKSFKAIDVKSFSPKSGEELRCKEIAESLGEKDMSFILSSLRQYGIRRIERAWGIVNEIKQKHPDQIDDPRRYFNTLVRTLKD